MDQLPRYMCVEHEIRIRAYEIDVIGVVSNIEYVKYAEDLRHEFLDRYYPFDEMMRSHLSPVLLNTDIHYKIPLTIHDRPVGRCWVARMTVAKWEIGFEIVSEAGMHCFGTQKGGFFDTQQRKPVRCPRRLLDRFEDEKRAAGRA